MADDYVCGQVRIMEVREERLFCVTTRAPFDALDSELARLMPLLEAAKEAAGLQGAGPVVVRYFATEEEGVWQMDVGVPVTGLNWVEPGGGGQIVTLPALRVGALLHWGSLSHIIESYDALNRGIADAELRPWGEGREWYLHFAGDQSAENIILLQLEVQE